MHRRRFVLAAAAAVVAAVGPSPGLAAQPPGYTVANVGAYGGEPSLVSDSAGRLYDTTPSGGTITYTSTNSGASWQKVTTADPSSGDDCLATDQANSVYLCNLAGSQGVAPLQADVWKSVDHGTTWAHGAGAIPQCATSCSAFGVDRDWVAASILPPATSTSQAEVVLMYHDFYGPSQIWVNISHDGGATFGPAQEVLASPAVTPGAVTGTLVAQGYTFCNTVPAGVGIAPPGTPHAGRIIVAWIAADLAQNATGCNVSMLQSFHTLWVSYSDDNGLTWTPQQAFDAGIGHDASTPFAAFTIDDQGNPYYGFANNLSSNPATCSAESTAGTVQSDFSCEYDMYVVWSADGGQTWDGGGGLIPGSAGKAYRVNGAAETGTHWFPAIAAASPGKVDVAYLRTTEILPTDAFGKADAGGCAGPQATGNPPTYPPPCKWNLYAAQSTNLTSSPAAATWTVTQITTTPMHIGDICNLGIFCVAPSSNRNLLDFIMEDLDPRGCAHIAYADDNTVNMLRAANQTSGSCLKK
ncbi:MAG TPA: sialidase family protein [Candidatus Dormibacteraeota bacterium]|nr:sialidase family protein [Candidatus Dormibacteraeota bacterium]